MDADASVEAYAFIDRNRRTMERMLGYALDEHQWRAAQSVFIPLQSYRKQRGLHEESKHWSDRALHALADAGAIPALADLPALRLEDPQGEVSRDPERLSAALRWRDALWPLSLWSVATMEQADRLTRAGDFDAAESRYRELLRVQERVPGLSRTALALIHGGLGFVAEERGRLADAQEWYRKALAIYEESDDRAHIAVSLRHLGSVAKDLGLWDEAESNYRRALAMLNELTGDVHNKQLTYDALGRLMESRGRLGEAEEWYAESLTLAEQRHDWDGIARSSHGLGMLARRSGRMPEAEHWYRRALSLAEKVGDRRGMAASYFELGMVALQQRRAESEEWFRRSLALHESVDDGAAVARAYRMLALIAIARRQMDEARRLLSEALAIVEGIGLRDEVLECYQLLGGLEQELSRWDEAERWLRKALAVGARMGHDARVAVCYFQLGMLAEARGDAAEALESIVRGLAVGRQFPHFARAKEPGQALQRATKQLGIGAVQECWQRVTGEPLPADILRLALLERDRGRDEPPAGS